ncbi:hypothetical protein CR5_031 [Cronobacter phage CR5]|uniref:hypothetical protein n=1 Tax=Cronobacter phage CR5 TaxID=1195085 RepID=UPI0003428534|nr:hypothetical protein CR5_031 [Cronobacter phage CR5]EBZ2963385.1 hypothetical protein [Salmonella enterica subsp. enterica serovar Enteritidis]ECG1798703.1 hypothetical protein [Salmonella enterica subsp. enterica serovar Paratyphi B]ECG3268932.1 hypothetical protein [Salmonella enterica subsp. enterica serovar Infantis]EIP7032271.1 hypothetical protein [Salmonella enterica]AFO71251.1 hypothetical protein CR5_031 [Cronobacter phage CR5]
MNIEKIRESVVISRNGETITFNNVPHINRKKNTVKIRMEDDGDFLSRDQLLFLELNRLWGTFSEKELDEVWEIYKNVQLLVTEPDDVRFEVLPDMLRRLVELHYVDRYIALYPQDKVWIPKKLENNFDNISPNYTEAMTYLVSDYYNLMTFTLALKPLIPVFAAFGAYPPVKMNSQSARRKIVTLTNDCFEILLTSKLGSHPAIQKLRDSLPHTIVKIQKEAGSQNSNAPSLTLIAVVEGYGIDALEEYITAFTVVNILALQPVGADFKEGVMDENSIVSRIFYGIRPEVLNGFADKMSAHHVTEKPHASTMKLNGERGKTSVIDTVNARSTAPIKESERTAFYFTEYRRALKRIEADIAPARCKQHIDGIIEHHPRPFSELHEWLVSVVLHRHAHRGTYKDVDQKAFMHGMGIAQAIWASYGMFSAAALLSCSALPGRDGLEYPFLPIESDIKEKSEIYYPQAYRAHKGTETISPLRESVMILIRDYINPYSFHLKTSPEVAEILGVQPEVKGYIPGKNLQMELSEMLLIQARQKHRELHPLAAE